MFYLTTAPYLLQKIYSECIWKINTDKKEIFLTFDDGPTPEVTWFVLGELAKFQARATFFCIGSQVKNYPALYKEIIAHGHRTGNHTYDHLNGWRVKDNEYIDNIQLAKDVINSRLFRPPYGKITKFQLKILEGDKFRMKTVMWTVLSGDFDTTVSNEKCYQNVVRNTREGSIVVFHDSEKAFTRLRYALPKTLDHFAAKGFQFNTLPL